MQDSTKVLGGYPFGWTRAAFQIVSVLFLQGETMSPVGGSIVSREECAQIWLRQSRSDVLGYWASTDVAGVHFCHYLTTSSGGFALNNTNSAHFQAKTLSLSS